MQYNKIQCSVLRIVLTHARSSVIICILTKLLRSVLYIQKEKENSMSSELKPRSMRIDDETLKKFQEISKNIEGNQQETLSKLIEAYELQADKAIIADRKADIENFENYVTLLSQMYRKSLADYQNCTEKVRATFYEQLESKDDTILKLQKENNMLKAEYEQAISDRKLMQEQITILNDKIKNEYEARLEDLQKMIADNKSHIDLLKKENEHLKQHKEDTEKFRSECEKAKEKITELEEQNKQQSIEWEQEKLLLKEQYLNNINELQSKHYEEIENYQQKYRSALDKLEDQKSSETKSKRTVKKSNSKKSVNGTTNEDQKNEPS